MFMIVSGSSSMLEAFSNPVSDRLVVQRLTVSLSLFSERWCFGAFSGRFRFWDSISETESLVKLPGFTLPNSKVKIRVPIRSAAEIYTWTELVYKPHIHCFGFPASSLNRKNIVLAANNQREITGAREPCPKSSRSSLQGYE